MDDIQLFNCKSAKSSELEASGYGDVWAAASGDKKSRYAINSALNHQTSGDSHELASSMAGLSLEALGRLSPEDLYRGCRPQPAFYVGQDSDSEEEEDERPSKRLINDDTRMSQMSSRTSTYTPPQSYRSRGSYHSVELQQLKTIANRRKSIECSSIFHISRDEDAHVAHYETVTKMSQRSRNSRHDGGGDADLQNDSDGSAGTFIVRIKPKKRLADPEAYNKWLAAKNEEVRRRRKAEYQKKVELELKRQQAQDLRQKLSQEKLQQWIERKQCQRNLQPKKQSSITSIRSDGPVDSKEERERSYNKWLVKVARKEKEERSRRQKELEQKQFEEELRLQKREMSSMIYSEWLKTAKYKPKPVPLNQGKDTLRGSISQMFINPVPWQD